MKKNLQRGVPADNLPLANQTRGNVNRAGFYKLEEGRNRKERRMLAKLNRVKRFSDLIN